MPNEIARIDKDKNRLIEDLIVWAFAIAMVVIGVTVGTHLTNDVLKPRNEAYDAWQANEFGQVTNKYVRARYTDEGGSVRSVDGSDYVIEITGPAATGWATDKLAVDKDTYDSLAIGSSYNPEGASQFRQQYTGDVNAYPGGGIAGIVAILLTVLCVLLVCAGLAFPLAWFDAPGI